MIYCTKNSKIDTFLSRFYSLKSPIKNVRTITPKVKADAKGKSQHKSGNLPNSKIAKDSPILTTFKLWTINFVSPLISSIVVLLLFCSDFYNFSVWFDLNSQTSIDNNAASIGQYQYNQIQWSIQWSESVLKHVLLFSLYLCCDFISNHFGNAQTRQFLFTCWTRADGCSRYRIHKIINQFNNSWK